jgi:hypothetical protein
MAILHETLIQPIGRYSESLRGLYPSPFFQSPEFRRINPCITNQLPTGQFYRITVHHPFHNTLYRAKREGQGKERRAKRDRKKNAEQKIAS